MKQKEFWKDVPNYDGLYQVSNLGNVKSLRFNKELILKLTKGTNGYLCITLRLLNKSKTYKVHQLVAMAFLGHTPNGLLKVIDHINNDKLDNRLENLQLVSNRYNSHKTDKKYSSKYKGVSWDSVRKKWYSQIMINKKIKNLGRFENEYDAYLAYELELNKI
jgi:hypothetical protein